MIKQIYAQSGKPGISRSRYVEIWRDHGGIAMMCPDYFDHVARYVQSDVLAAATRAAGGDASYFGIGELCFEDTAARDAANLAPSRAERIVPHGTSMFGHARPISMPCQEHALFNRRQGMAKVYAFVQRDAALSREAFLTAWAEAAQVLQARLQRDATACSHVQSRSIDPASAFDGVDELTFDDAAGAVSFVQAGYRAALPPGTQVTLVVTEQVVMYRRSNYTD